MDARILTIGAEGTFVAAGYAIKGPARRIPAMADRRHAKRRRCPGYTENGVDWVAGEADDIPWRPAHPTRSSVIRSRRGEWVDGALGQPMITPEESALAHSDDGVHWRALAPVPGSATGAAPAENVAGVGVPDGQRIIWTFDEADNMVRLWRAEGPGVDRSWRPRPREMTATSACEARQPWLIGASEWGGEVPRLRVSCHLLRGPRPAWIRGSRRDQVARAVARRLSRTRGGRVLTGGDLVES